MSLRSHVDLIAAVAVTVFATVATVTAAPLVVRLPLGLLAVLFAPGYTVVAALFPRKDDLDTVTRIGVSVGTSIIVTAALAPLLSHSPWRLRAIPIVIALDLTVVLAAAFAAWRRRETADQPSVAVLPSTASARDASVRVGAVALVAALVVAGAGLYRTLRGPEAAVTEFYVLGLDGRTERYLERDPVEGSMRMTIGITQGDEPAATYRVVVTSDSGVLRTLGPIVLGAGEHWEEVLALNRPFKGRRVVLSLFRDGHQDPYRSLQVWADADDRSGGPRAARRLETSR